MTASELWELDQAVAAAIGIDGTLRAADEWHPSTDWNDAMFAAEKAGCNCLRFNGDEWEVCEPLFYVGYFNVLASAETGPLAICKAILKSKTGIAVDKPVANP